MFVFHGHRVLPSANEGSCFLFLFDTYHIYIDLNKALFTAEITDIFSYNSRKCDDMLRVLIRSLLEALLISTQNICLRGEVRALSVWLLSLSGTLPYSYSMPPASKNFRGHITFALSVLLFFHYSVCHTLPCVQDISESI